jgi:hypothetical protein
VGAIDSRLGAGSDDAEDEGGLALLLIAAVDMASLGAVEMAVMSERLG